ncbi:MAG: DUF3107 domain-containing protein [Actinobacteria bacterium]|uniref:DUF3107 domain-containing protein n=1 Tax=Candidatus Fonsibacter lacus TaxID=2576439 RepID=A0A965GD54_9PROT|nr:DUF3107 domain-containing protein [Candidatus Fonsibacter lacus]
MSTKKSAESASAANAASSKVEVRIGISDSPRELTIELTNSADEIETSIAHALHEGSHISFTDERGRRLIVPAAKVGFVEVSARSERKVGFGTN